MRDFSKVPMLLAAPVLALALGGCDPDIKPGEPGSGGDDDGGSSTDTGGEDYLDIDQDGFTTETDCDDTNPSINPAASELCDGVDNDCDGSVDEGVKETFYADADGDGYGNGSTILEACEQGEGMADNTDDCDDGNGDVFPGADEYCNGIDDDCDDEIDEPDAVDALTFHADSDGDGFGDPDVTTVACTLPAEHVENADDCDDGDDDVNPDADEICNAIDDDCDGDVDTDAIDAPTWYADDDGDGYGLEDVTQVSCDRPEDYTGSPGDCDDEDAEINPGASEICDGIDNDCDSRTTEPGLVTFVDADGEYFDSSADFAEGTSREPVRWTLVEDGTYYFCEGTYYVSLDFAGDISIVGVHGSDETILNTAYAGSVLVVDNNGVDVSIEGVTLQDGYGDGDFFGGPSYATGGGLYCAATADVSLTDVVIEDGQAEVGGGVYVESCDVDLRNVSVIDNYADFGGGAAIFDGAVSITDSLLEGNSAEESGGAIYLDGDDEGTDPSLSLVDSLVDDNSAYVGGGAAIWGATLTCRGSTDETSGFINNAADFGGAVLAEGSFPVRSSTCDWGTGGSDNAPEDIYLYPAGNTFDFGSDESFSCGVSDCD